MSAMFSCGIKRRKSLTFTAVSVDAILERNKQNKKQGLGGGGGGLMSVCGRGALSVCVCRRLP